MLRFVDECRLRSGRLTRRQWLALGSLAGLGGIVPSQHATSKEPHFGRGFGRARSVVLVFASGGQSQIDMWDPKPNAPLDVRGAFRAVSTAVPGIQFCEYLPRTAKVADKLTVVRSMSHEDLDHGSAVYLALTGCYHPVRSSNPSPSPGDAPTYGVVLRRVREGSSFVFDAIHVNGPALVPSTPAPGQNGGVLGSAFEPLVIGDAAAAQEALPGLTLRAEMPTVRLSNRRSLKQSLDDQLRQLAASEQVLDFNRRYAEAYQILASPTARHAFDLNAEPAALRDRYGRHRSGQALLLARRLVEAGVPYINVIWNHSNRGQDKHPDDTDLYGWDTHNDIFEVLRNRLLPRFDESFSAFLVDLDERGLLDQTLVLCMGEFGRAPRVAIEPNFAGASPGRKHWARVYSIVLAGAGIQRGAVVGASDRLGAEPLGQHFGPWDVAATLFHALGIDAQGHYADSLGRSFPVSTGQPIGALY